MRSPLLSAALVAFACALSTLGAWALFNQPRAEPPWPEKIQGIAFSPYQRGQDATLNEHPTVEQIDADLALLAGRMHALRTYATDGTLGEIPRLAARHDINVMLGAWLDRRLDNNTKEIDRLVRLAQHRNVVRVVVGNETLHRGNLTPGQLIEYLEYVQARVARPVSTAETWDMWMAHPELVPHVDYIAAHILPYWEGIEVDQAVAFVAEKVDQLKRRYPGKPIVIAEVGWPSEGRARRSAEAGTANQAQFMRRFLHFAQAEGYVYYVLEAFDQPWKRTIEGAVGEYWGIYNVDRELKFPLHDPIVRVPDWQLLAGVSISVGLVLLAILFAGSPAMATGGHAFLAVIVYTTATLVVWVIYDYLNQYLSFASVVTGALLLSCMLALIGVLLAEAHEWAEAHWTVRRRRTVQPAPGCDGPCPKVSLHVPAHNEPPALLVETLNALARLEYPNFEVIVVDNNTPDESTWRPVEAHCAALGARFRFFHVAPLAGFKAGALNFALRQTAADAEIVAVIDSDYVVDPLWLNDLVRNFADPRVALVQAPQDYRDGADSAFKAMCCAEYRGFFCIGMVTRNERNAIIQHGTMTLVRRRVLDDLEGWAEWCITEDAELGLRIFEQGLEAVYSPRSYGRGLTPYIFSDYKKQRYRWAYGAIQIMKHHALPLFLGLRSRLTLGQRYHFLAGWLPWLADGANLLFNFAALAWSAAMIAAPRSVDAPIMIFSALPLMLFVFKLAKLAHLYRERVGASVAQILAAAVAGLALTHTIGIAVLRGLLTRNEPFIRTPKQDSPRALIKALMAAREEALMLAGLVLAAHLLGAASAAPGPDQNLWEIVLLIQAIPYAATVLTSMVSSLRLPARLIGVPRDLAANPAPVPG